MRSVCSEQTLPVNVCLVILGVAASPLQNETEPLSLSLRKFLRLWKLQKLFRTQLH